MIRVAFEYPPAGWTGGLNYLRNLFTALRSAPGLGIEQIVLAGIATDVAGDLVDVEVLRTPLLDTRDPRRLLRLGWRGVTGADPALERFLARHAVGVLSHSGYLGARARIPAITWFADFQHRRLPEMFSASERRMRDGAISAYCRYSARVIVSSEAARKDLERDHARWLDKIRVLQFVDCSSAAAVGGPLEPLLARYGLATPFLLLPNQFWVHKNHRLVLEALSILRRRGHSVRVIATGDTSDYRNPGFFGTLMRFRAEAGVEEDFRVLGLVPYSDLVTLMRHAVALVNPSLFEGWSTTVEEAKSLGKRMLLSEIEVHREQAPERAIYFDPRDAGRLADAMWQAWTSHDAVEDRRAAERAAANLPARRRAFAEGYARIVREVA